MLRIGRIAYANCTPIFHALSELYPDNDYTFVHGVPAELNRQLANAEIDICPSSSIEYALRPERYLIMPHFSISSCGPVASVLLFSTLPLDQLDNKTILLSSESATSVNLLKILLALRYGCTCTFRATGMNMADALQEAPALLLIGDAALRSAAECSAPYVYDLGELWYEWTGKPFVFALWLVARDAEAREGQALRRLARRLEQARMYAEQHLERISETSPDAVWMGRDRLLSYWRHNISYELNEQQIEGLNLFYASAVELGLIASAPTLAFLEAF